MSETTRLVRLPEVTRLVAESHSNQVGIAMESEIEEVSDAMDPVKRYLSKIGRKGGSVKSDAKTAAARANILKRWAKVRAQKRAKKGAK